MIKTAAIIIGVIAVLVLCAVLGLVLWLVRTLDEVDIFDPWQ